MCDISPYLSLDLSTGTIACLAAATVAMLTAALIYCRLTSQVRRAARRHGSCQPAMPGVSVIVYERDNLSGLGELLPTLLNQQYDGEFDVIVVSDGSGSDARDLVTRIAGDNRNMHLTFVPDEAHNLSRRKLAITLGVKASHRQYVIVTTAEARPAGDKWLAGMARNFATGHDVVLGHALFDRTHDRGLTGVARAFDRAVDAATYLSAAASGAPYRGSGCNIGFRRQLFFDCKGFAGSLNLHAGHDDIFVSNIASHGRVAVELDPGTLVTLDIRDPRREHRLSKISHRFTGRRVSRHAPLMISCCSWLMWIWLGCSIAAVILGRPSLIPAIIAILTAITLAITLAVVWSRALATLGERISPRLIPVLLLCRPFATAATMIRSRLNPQQHYTWHNVS